MRNIAHLIRLIPGYRGRFAIVVAVNVLLGLGTVLTPYLFKQIVDSITALAGDPAASIDTAKVSVVTSLLILAAIRFVTIVVTYFQQRVSDLLYLETMWALRRQIFSHLTRISIEYYEQHRVGEIVQKINNATMQLRLLIEQWAEGSLLSVLTLVFITTVLLIQLPPVGLLMLVMIPLMLGSAIFRIKQTQPVQREWTKLGEKTVGTMTETISLIAVIRSFGQERARLKQYEREVEEFREARVKHFRITWWLRIVQGLLIATTALAALSIVSFGALEGRYTAGDILLVLSYTQTVVGSIYPIVRLIISTGEVEIAAERAVELLQVEPTVVDKPGATGLKRLESIEFRNVNFNYPGKEKQILKDISFRLEAGKTLALVGPSGVGKTTITKLLLRFYEPTSGEILINGRDIRQFTSESVRSHIGTVMQEVALFNDTVEANLNFARPEATKAELVAAAKAAHADTFIQNLPDAYQTLVGERGVKLSGGEKQRIAIARALLRNPELAILDEATSSLDSESERHVQAGLQELLRGRTAITIAHRLSTVRQADRIIVLQDGEIVERGTHKELADQQGGLYAHLYKLQTEGVLSE